ncbi:MAG: replicative DNA helicase [Oscillospiraceae bacterium]|nr:replicative DNA helicase [Oscillospiraceae bacterium]
MIENIAGNFNFDKLPYSMEAEQCVLACILIDGNCIVKVLDKLKIEYFFSEVNRHLYSIMVMMFTSAQPIDVITVLETAKREKVFPTDEEIKKYLGEIAQLLPTTANLESYAKIIEDKYYIRSLMNVANEIIENASGTYDDVKTLLDSAEQRIFEIRQGKDGQGLVPINQVIIETYDKLQRLSGENKDSFTGIPTGFSQLDKVILGLNKSDLILLAARPAMGKTAFALNIVTNVAIKSNKSVAFFSLEMSRDQLVTRVLSSIAKIKGISLKTGELTVEDWNRLAVSAQELSKAKIYIDDMPGVSVSEMKAKIRRLRNIDLVVIDYLQLMQSARRIDNRVQEISDITRSLKVMAKELDVPVIALSQLSRSPDNRTEHQPKLSDLRDSGSIEQDADIVMFLYREAYYDKACENPNIAECIVAKNRHGETSTVELSWDGQYTKFENLEIFRDEPY